MSETTFGRATVAGLLMALVIGCSETGSGSAGGAGPGPTSEATATSTPVTPSPAPPNPLTPDSSTPDSSTPSSPAPNPSAPNPSTPNPPTPIPEPVDPPQVAWVPPGPGNTTFPYDNGREARWASAVDDRNCDAIAALGPEREQQQLYSGLGAACRAVRSNNDQLWTSAEVALQQVDDPIDCLDRSALRLLRDLVMAHRRAPRANIHIVDSPPGPRCDPDSSSPPPTPISPTPTPVPRPSTSAG